MNVTTTTSATATTDVGSSKSSSSVSNKSGGKSFDEEIKSASQNVEKVEDTSVKEENNVGENASQTKDSNNEADKLSEVISQEEDLIASEMLSGAVNFTDFKYHNESQSLLSQNIQNLLNTRELVSTVHMASTFEYDVINMSDSDANFFANLVQNTDMSMKDIATQIMQSSDAENISSNVQVSSVLMEKLAESLKTNQPFRIDFDKDVSVIIKVNKDGSIAANFIPGDKAVEQYLKNNIAFLKNRFDEENLSYSELTYSNSKNRNQKQKQKKENDNE